MVSQYFTPSAARSHWNFKRIRNFIEHVNPLDYYISLDPTTEDTRSTEAEIFEEIDFLIRFENLAEDFSYVAQHLGLDCDTLPWINRSRREHYSSYFDNESRFRVAKKFAAEIEFGKYIFEKA